jgi:putative tricarboxylic transport membrane protein
MILPLRRIDVGKAPKSDIVPAVILIVSSIVLYWIIIPNQIHVPSQVKSAFLSPAFAPKAFTLFLGCMALVLLLFALVRLRLDFTIASIKRLNMKGILREEGVVFAIVIICFVFVVSIEYLGMVIPSIFFLGIMMSYFGQRKWGLILIIMLLVPLILYFFFHDLAKVVLPKGSLFSLEQLL